MIYAKYYKPCENCGRNYLQQRKGTKYCKACRNEIRNHGILRPHAEVKRFRRSNPDPTVPPKSLTPPPTRRFKRKEPGSPVQRVLSQLAAQGE